MARKVSAFDRFLLRVAPSWALSRLRARAAASFVARHYEAASIGRRTSNWSRSSADANVAAGPSLAKLRALARDLRRNNPWVRRGLQVISNNAVGWGIIPKPAGPASAEFLAAWKAWAETTDCDADGRLTFAGLQRQVMDTVAEAGEVLVRRRWRQQADQFSIPLQLQILEPDYLDTDKDNQKGTTGGPIVQGVEFNNWGQRLAYWLFERHPGSALASGFTSRRIDATEIQHVYRQDRPGQVRGVSWCAPIIMRTRDFDEYEDATVMRHKVAALFAAFITDPQGDPSAAATGEQGTDAAGLNIETLEPGALKYLAPGQSVEFAAPPVPADGGFTERALRSMAAGLGVTYEDLTGDYTKVNYSSGRLGWLSHWANVEDWRWNMLVPQFCDASWDWAVEAAAIAGILPADSRLAAEWTPPARPMIDPDKEGLAYQRRVRSGALCPSEMVREQGRDPAAHWRQYAADLAELDRLGIWLDSDVRRVSAAGLTQARPAATGFNDAAKDASEMAPANGGGNGAADGAAEDDAGEEGETAEAN